MQVKIRKKLTETAEGSLRSSQEVYEWSPAPNHWYAIHRRRITGLYPEGNAELTRNLMNALLRGLTCVVRARYFRNSKILQVDL